MRVKFELRTVRKTTDFIPLTIRLVDRGLDKRVKTKILVPPQYWDQKLESIRSRSLCPPNIRIKVTEEMAELTSYIVAEYCAARESESFNPQNWLEDAVDKFYNPDQPKSENHIKTFDDLYTEFLSSRDLSEGRRRHYEVQRRMIHRYCAFKRYSSRRRRKVLFDVKSVSSEQLDEIYDYIKNEYRYIEQYPQILEDYPETKPISERSANYMTTVFKKLRAFFNWCKRTNIISVSPFDDFSMPGEQYGTPIYLSMEDVRKIYETDFSSKPNLDRQRDIFVFQCNVGCRVGDLIRLKKQDVIKGAIEYIPTKTIKETARTVVVPLNNVAQAIIDKYKDSTDESLLPFISAEKYNDAIKEVFTEAGITYLVTELDPLTRKEKKVPINEIASSHMARRTFIGNIYKLVKDPSLVSALTGHVEGSRAFNRYRAIDMEMKKDLVSVLDIEK